MSTSGKPLYKKKRVIIPAFLVALMAFGAVTGGNQEKPADASAPQGIVSAPKTTPTPDQAAASASAAAEQAAAQASASASASASAAAEQERLAAEQVAAQAAAEAKAAADAAAAKAAADAQAAAQAQADAAAKAAADATRKAAVVAPAPKATKVPTSTYYANCTAVRAAGAAPIYAGQPGYSRKLDRDGDGVACE